MPVVDAYAESAPARPGGRYRGIRSGHPVERNAAAMTGVYAILAAALVVQAVGLAVILSSRRD